MNRSAPPHILVNAANLQRFFTTYGWRYTVHDELKAHPAHGRIQSVPVPGCRPIECFHLTPLALLQPGSLMIAPSGAILRESLFYPEVQFGLSTDLPLQQFPLNEAVVPLNSIWFNEFWHWIHEFLPRVAIAELAGFRGHYLLDPASPPFVRESLQLMGIADERLTVARPGVWLHREVWVPEILRASYELDSVGEILLEVRKRVLAGIAAAPSTEQPKRIYISRRSATRRRLINEEEIVKLLEQFSFKTIEMENISFADQVGIFSQAESVVTVHGAALAHSLFMPPRSFVIELFSPHFIHPNSPVSNRLLELRHVCIIGDKNLHPLPATPAEANHQDVLIEPQELERALRSYLPERPPSL